MSADVWVRVHPHICVLRCLGHFAIACWAHWAFGCFGAGLRIFAISFAASMLGRLDVWVTRNSGALALQRVGYRGLTRQEAWVFGWPGGWMCDCFSLCALGVDALVCLGV